jgi:DNA-binding NtrC family response regulator
MKKPTIYLVDDESIIRQNLCFGLRSKYQVEAFASAEQAWPALEHKCPDLVVLDLALPGQSGLELLPRIKELYPVLPVLIITANDGVPTAVAAMKGGAQDYLIKPLQLDELKLAISKALNNSRIKDELSRLQARVLKEDLPIVVGRSDAIVEIMDYVAKVAKSRDTPILILGESGTGKELLAQTIHHQSPRRDGPFVPVNCASIPAQLLESEFFGYSRGAFTGALPGGKVGFIEEAEEGTLFLDEVAELHHDLQAKLLRFMENGEFYRLGETKPRRAMVRIVSATNKNLEELVGNGHFRLDLYYRLAVVQVSVPSLSQRPQDIMPIAEHFLKEFNRKHDRDFIGFAPEVAPALKTRAWIGNIRELRNLVERGVLVGQEPLLNLSDLERPGQKRAAVDLSCNPAVITLTEAGLDINQLEANLIREAYKLAGGNDKKAAALLNMNYYTFRYRRKLLDQESSN